MNRTMNTLALTGAATMLALGAAHAESNSYDLSGFTVVEASAGVDVEITVGGDYAVRAEGDADALEHLRIELDGETLEIGRENRRGFFSGMRRGKVTVYVSTPSLNGVSVSSGADLEASGIDAGDFSASVSSGADAELSGTCGKLKADGSSGADLDAENLQCTDVAASVSSGADLIVYASQSINASASSGGDVVVFGDPQNTNVSKSSGGGVSINK